MTDRVSARKLVLVGVALAALTVAVFGGIVTHGFVYFDDTKYITANPHLAAGLTLRNIGWAFTTLYFGIWHPLTWISYLVDVQIWGLAPVGAHLGNLVLHVANALLLGGLLFRATRRLWCSAFVAALFAIHPLHVESVAWAAERKDVLSTLFWLLTLWAYQRYGERCGLGRYALVVLAFAGALLSKPMMVTLPVVLLLWDFWPLERIKAADRMGRRVLVRMVLEKIPLLALAAPVAVVAVIAARAEGAVVSLASLPLAERVSNSLVGAATYVTKTVWPSKLACFYPPHRESSPALLLGAALLIAAATGLALFGRRRWLFVGWSWFLVTLAPVIGLVQVAGQARADRYTYVPLIGVFIVVAWGVPELVARLVGPARWRVAAKAIAVAAVAAIAALSAAARIQVGYWRDSATLFKRALDVTENNWFAENWYGYALARQGDRVDAEAHIRRAIDLVPADHTALFNLGELLAEDGRFSEAAEQFAEVVRLKPDWETARYNLGTTLRMLGRFDDALPEFEAAVRLKPDYGDAQNSLGAVLLIQGRLDAAEEHLSEASRLQPESAMPHCNLAMVHAMRRAFPQAWTELDECRRLGGEPDPNFVADLTREAPRSTP